MRGPGPRKTLIDAQTVHRVRTSYRGQYGPRIFKNVSFFYIHMRVKGTCLCICLFLPLLTRAVFQASQIWA